MKRYILQSIANYIIQLLEHSKGTDKFKEILSTALIFDCFCTEVMGVVLD